MSKIGSLFRGLYSVFLFITKNLLKLLSNVSLYVSFVYLLVIILKYAKSRIEKCQCLVDLVYWRDLKKSGIALGLSLFALIAVSKISLITLFAYGSLLVLCGTLGFRAFKLVEARVKGTEPTHPFEELLKEELVIPGEKVHGQVDVLVGELQCIVNKLQKIVLIDNICESVKFALFCWILTYVGACISLFCIAFLAIVGVFTIPKVYEMYKEPIDANLKLVKEQLNAVCVTVHEKLPFLGSLCCNKSTAPQVEEEKKDQ